MKQEFINIFDKILKNKLDFSHVSNQFLTINEIQSKGAKYFLWDLFLNPIKTIFIKTISRCI